MTDFSNCSGIAISGGNFTKANHISNIRIIRRSVVQRKEERRTRWDDYNRVRIGDICIEGNITTTSDHDDDGAWKQYQPGQDMDARRNFGIARLRGEDSKDKFLCVTYEGSEAFKAFKQDFDEFSQIKHANVAQIFGFNDNERGLPALLFYDALIPLERIIRGDDGWNLPLLYSYFDYQLGKMRREVSVGALQRIAELWVDPRTGALQRGPYIAKTPGQDGLLLGTIESAMPNIHSSYLSISTLSDNDLVLDYLARAFTTHTVLQGIHWFARPFVERLVNEHVAVVLSSLPGTIYNRHSRKIVAMWPGARERLQYMVGTVYRIPNAMRDSQFVIDGSVRFTTTSTEMKELQEIHLRYSLPWEKRDILERAWLAQAHHVFGQLQIHADEWKDYTMPFGFDICLRRTSPPKEINIPPKVYLFVPPVPRPSDDESIWRSWLEGERYFWSFDPFGQEKVSDLELASSGIPSFASMIFSFGYTWTPSHYEIMQKLHVAKNFDPVTTDLALSTGYPVLQVVGDGDRFKDLKESSPNMSPPQTGRRGTIEHPTRASAVRPNYTSSTKKRTTLHAKPLKSPSSVQTSSRQQQVLGEKEKGQGIGRDPSRDSASTIMSRASEHESKAPGTCSLPKFDADTTRHVKLFATKECLKQQIVSAGPNQGTKDSSRRSMDRERADGEPSRPKVPRVVASPARQPPWR